MADGAIHLAAGAGDWISAIGEGARSRLSSVADVPKGSGEHQNNREEQMVTQMDQGRI